MKYAQIYLRKLPYEQAELKLRKELDHYYILEYKKIRIVHGKGKGILKRMVREYLEKQPFVKKFEDAPFFEGGYGVTIVNFY